jgi:hypothetical protein
MPEWVPRESNKWLHEIRKTMQDMKGEFNKDIEILEKNQIKILKMKNLKLKNLSWKCS